MNKETNRNNHPRNENLPDLAGSAQQEDPFADLQSLWDEQSRRIDHILAAHPEARPARLNLRHRRPWRRRVMAECLALAVLNIAAGLYTLASFLPDPYILIRVTGYVLASTNALMAFHSLYILLSFRRHHPARVATSRMSRFIRRSRMRPHYGTFPAGKRKASMPAPTHESDASDLFSNHVRFRARQAAAASIAALFALTVVSCSTTGIDGNTINQDNPDRIATVENVAQIIDRI